MHKIPITILFMTSTKGHYGYKNVYETTIRDLDRQIPLSHFVRKIAHLKTIPGDESIAQEMKEVLKLYDFEVHETIGDWQRGQSHQNQYMQDLIKMSKIKDLYQTKYMLWLEDDSTLTPHKTSLEELLMRMVEFLDSTPETISVRLLRSGDLDSSPFIARESDFFWSPHFNFQPLVIRTRDFFIACATMEKNLEATKTIQCEMLWRLILDNFSNSARKHIVWLPDYAETHHLGSPEYPKLKEMLKL